jgi:hypothetical protein
MLVAIWAINYNCGWGDKKLLAVMRSCGDEKLR